MKTNQELEKCGERLSFYNLFTEKKLSIEIPIIQRDYAQGRKSQSEVRIKFLDALYSYLDENIAGRDLDFVYGSISEIEGKKVFIPLDGQQRLTTLFLLHWYLALLVNRKSELEKNLTSDGKSLFTYETRASAREFCDALLLKNIDYLGLRSSYKISNIIQNCSWYFMSWKYDPTIQAMLVMLDEIETKFGERADFFERLTVIEKPIITFQFLDLKEFHLTDDLYIKMNSRGKPLSPFENFKAKLEQKIEKLFKEDTIVFELKSSAGSRMVSAHHYFSNMIDTVWLNYFWEIGGYNPKLVDGNMINFIRVVLSNSYALINNDNNQNNLRILFKSQDAKTDEIDLTNLSYFDYLNLGAITKQAIDVLIASFEKLISISKLPEDSLPDVFHYQHGYMFEKVADYTLSAQERLRFYAFLEYLILYEDKIDGLKDWMRVVYNLTENTRIDDADILQSGLKEIKALIPFAPNILSWITNKDNSINLFYSRQVEEERIKAFLLIKNTKWKDKIWETEKHSFIQGQIGFLFEFSGILQYYSMNGNCSWCEKEDVKFFNLFNNYVDKAIATFDYLQKRKDEEYLWERAVLSKGDYLIPNSYHRYHFLTTTGLTERDNSWKRLLRLNRDNELEDKRGYIKDVFDDVRFDPTDVVKSFLEILKNKVTDWRFYFINRPQLVQYCKKGFIRKDDNLNIQLLETTKLTYHYELRTIELYLNSFENKSFSPLEGLKYVCEYGYEGHSHIHVGEFRNKSYAYSVNIYYKNNSYSILMQKILTNLTSEGHDPDLQTICSNIGFAENDRSGLLINISKDSEVVSVIKDLTAKLNEIK